MPHTIQQSLQNEAFGRPGIPPRWTSSRKEGVGTAYHTASRVWFTLSHGILNEIYYPTIDSPQTRDMEFLVTDGETFFHEEKRNLDHRIECIERGALGYRFRNVDLEGRYVLEKEVIADPHQSVVLIHVRLDAAPEWRERLQVYALLAPHLGKGGAGNSAKADVVAGNRIIVAWKGLIHLAYGCSTGFSRTSCGFVGASDGWTDLKRDLRLDWAFDHATAGNVAIAGQIDLSRGNEFVAGIGFGDSRHAAVTKLVQSLAIPFASHRSRFIIQWRRVGDKFLDLGRHSTDGGRLYCISRSLLLAHEDKTYAGALIASASIPWGQAKGDEDLGGYHLVWTRDMVQSAAALLACGDTMTPFRALVYLAASQRPDGGFPQNFWIDGQPYFNSIQVDEVAFPIMLAWRLWKADALQDFDPWPMVAAGARFLVEHGPVTQQERWEEASGYSPSTLAATIAALICAADFARSRGDNACAEFLESQADFMESHVERWTVTTEGALLPGVPEHYIRIRPVSIDDVRPDEDPNRGELTIAGTPAGQRFAFPAKDVVDAGFLELVRYGIRAPDDPIIVDSLRVVDAVLKVDTPCGPCWHRYSHDHYGEHDDGSPYDGTGKGRAWPLLTGERAHYELAAGRDVTPFVQAMECFASAGGMLPEQVWDEPDNVDANMALGRPTGAAMPLMWAHAEYIKLLRSIELGRPFDRIDIVADRYLNGSGRTGLEVWKPTRQPRCVRAGDVLRVQAPAEFVLRWSTDDWHTVNDIDSTCTPLGVCFADIPVGEDQQAPARFTFFWKADERWERQDYSVGVVQAGIRRTREVAFGASVPV